MIKTQDWEFAEELLPNEWETVEIQIATEQEAITKAQNWATRYSRRCLVSTSLRCETSDGVGDRMVIPTMKPIIINPQT